MPSLKNKSAKMEIGYTCFASDDKQLYVQIGNVREYYGKLKPDKAKKFLRMLAQWDEAGGNDGLHGPQMDDMYRSTV